MPACSSALTKRAVCHGAGVSPGALARLQDTCRHIAVSRVWEVICLFLHTGWVAYCIAVIAAHAKLSESAIVLGWLSFQHANSS
jgi:hypothetical protein